MIDHGVPWPGLAKQLFQAIRLSFKIRSSRTHSAGIICLPTGRSGVPGESTNSVLRRSSPFLRRLVAERNQLWAASSAFFSSEPLATEDSTCLSLRSSAKPHLVQGPTSLTLKGTQTPPYCAVQHTVAHGNARWLNIVIFTVIPLDHAQCTFVRCTRWLSHLSGPFGLLSSPPTQGFAMSV